ncbi:MAG: cytochrome-c peroxidase, partial [Bacteroidia bacterium]|nr:cytochrome-c peroxidase [Bacteroidia bacterium]
PLRTASEMNSSWPEVTKKIKRNKTYQKLFYKAFGRVEIDSTLISKAIAQFERTLISANSKYDRVIRREAKFTLDELEGMELINDMTKGNCVHCHTTDGNGLGTTGLFSNNGLDEAANPNDFKDKGLGGYTKNTADYGKFKIPSLRNLLFTAPYMHDGRFKTLEEVLDFYSEHVKTSATIDPNLLYKPNRTPRLNRYEKQKIIAFLKTLSDSSFIENPAYSNPGMKH